MKVFKKLVALIVLTATVLTMAVPTFAKGYPDVPVISFGKGYVKDINYIKKHHGFDGVIKGKKFYPDKYFTKKQVLKIFINLYGKKNVPITKSDKKSYNKAAKAHWMLKKIQTIVKNSGGRPYYWMPGNFKVPRYLAASYIHGFLCKRVKYKLRK